MKNFEQPLHVSVIVTDERQLAGVYAVLASSTALAAALAALATGNASIAAPVLEAGAKRSADKPSSPEREEPADEEASGEDVVLDTDGHPWSAELHAGTKGRNADGRWKMKVGVKRPDPAPGYPLEEAPGKTATGTKADGPAPGAGASATAEAVEDEEDEFAAFASSKEDAAPAARNWSDADLSALCNQAAQALGGPAKVKETIALYLPDGATNHSRNIPADQREEFAKALEAEAGIEFAG